MTDREFVLSKVPQARYMNLSTDGDVCHSIDDDYNDRYLAHREPSRRAAWKAAARRIKRETSDER